MMKFDTRPTNLYSQKSSKHIARMDDNVDAKQILTSSPSVYWKRPLGRRDDLDEDGAERPQLPWAVMD